MGDTMQISLAGVIMGAAKQAVSMPIVIVAYFLVGLPTGTVLAFVCDLGLQGLWFGITLAASLHMLTYILIIFSGVPGAIQWDRVIDQATERFQEGDAPIELIIEELKHPSKD